MSESVWERFHQRMVEGRLQARYLEEWRKIRYLTDLPEDQSQERLAEWIKVDRMDEEALQYFRNALVLICTTYSKLAGMPDVANPSDFPQNFGYLSLPEPDATRFARIFTLRSELEERRKPKDQQPPYSSVELALAEIVSRLFNRLAIALNRAGPGLASLEVIGELEYLIGEYNVLLVLSTPGNRVRGEIRSTIANARYAGGRTYKILGDYRNARLWYEQALEIYRAIGERRSEEETQQQLAALHILESGDVDEAVRVNLETLTDEPRQARSLDLARALIGQAEQALGVGDEFETPRLLKDAENELMNQRYQDPSSQGLEAAFGQWVDSVPTSLKGNCFLRELLQVLQLYASIFGIRARLSGKTEVPKPLEALVTLMHQIASEAMIAEQKLDRRFTRMNARPLGPDEDAGE